MLFQEHKTRLKLIKTRKVKKNKGLVNVRQCTNVNHQTWAVNYFHHSPNKPQMNNTYCIVLKYNTKSWDCIGIG